MARVTAIGPDEAQVDYRLEESAGCGLTPSDSAVDAAVDYRMRETLTWFGGGLADLGVPSIKAGEQLTGEAAKDHARALMEGLHPATGVVLVKPKTVTDPRGTLPGIDLLAAIREAAARQGVEPSKLAHTKWGTRRWARLQRMVDGDPKRKVPGDVEHRASLKDLERLAAETGVDLAAVYGGRDDVDLAQAQRFRDRQVRVGDRGWDITIDIPKSPGVVWALGDAQVAAQLQELFRRSVMETLADVEAWCSYGMRGEHGNGKTATRVETSGLLGWVMWHDVARPVDGAAPDPHLHAHAVVAHLAREKDVLNERGEVVKVGTWGTPGNGGREFHRHIAATGAMAQARFRSYTTEAGYRWERTGTNGGWEMVGVPNEARHLFSKRNTATLAQAAKDLRALRGLTDGEALPPMPPGLTRVAAAKTREARARAAQAATQTVLSLSGESAESAGPPRDHADWRASWRAQTVREGLDPDAIVAAARRGGDGPAPMTGRGGGPGLPPVPPVAQIAAAVFDREHGVNAHGKVAHRAQVLAKVVDQLPAGLTTLAEADALTDAVLALQDGPAVLLPQAGPLYQTNRERFTSTPILEAEGEILADCRAGYVHPGTGRTMDGEPGLAMVPVEAAAMAISAFEVGRGFSLSAEQRAVVTRLVTAGHGVDAVIGVAGAGKTTIMSAARSAWESQGLIVAGAATAAVAAANLTAEAGIPSATVASWVRRITHPDGEGLAGVDVLVVDEAAMVDDRALAVIVAEARAQDVKVVMVGDPLQLRAVGVGGGFQEVHRQVGGLTLSENRRQTSELERSALATWRTGDREAALAQWASGGHVHAGEDRTGTLLALLSHWEAASSLVEGDAFDELRDVLVLAGTNTDVNELNMAIRAIRRQRGDLSGPDAWFAVGDGAVLPFAVGDHVRTRANDYRSRRDDAPPGTIDILNGFRGVVTGVDPLRGVGVQFKLDGRLTRTLWLPPAYIACGGLVHGTALTVAAAQGLTCQQALVYGMGLDANTLYAAMSRDRARSVLYLPRHLVESDADRIALGEPVSDAQALQRTLDAYRRTLAAFEDGLVLEEWNAVPAPIAEDLDPAADVPDWTQRPYGAWSHDGLHRHQTRMEQLIGLLQAVEDDVRRLTAAAAAGDGPQARRLTERHEQLTHATSLEDHLAAAEDALTRAVRRSQDLREQIEQLREQTRRNPIALRLAGTSRTQLTHQITALQNDLRQTIQETSELRARATTLRTEALRTYAAAAEDRHAPAWRPGDARRAVTALTGQWEQLHAAAIQADLGAARHGSGHRAWAAHLRQNDPQTLTEARRRLTATREELAARQLLHEHAPERADREEAARTEHQAARAQTAAQRRPQLHGPSAAPYRPGPTHGGPSRGIGR